MSSLKRGGISLIELLVVLSLIGILVSLILPATFMARESARQASCRNKLRQLGLSMAMYEQVRRHFPAGRLGCDDAGHGSAARLCAPNLPSEAKTGASAFVAVLPFLELSNLHDQLNVRSGGLWNRNVDDIQWYYIDQSKRWGVQQRPPVFVCPSDPSKPLSDVYYPVKAAPGSYALVNGTKGADSPLAEVKYRNDGMFIYVRRRTVPDVADGLSNTLMLGEVRLSDTWESSNAWTYAISHADTLRTTRNPLNTPPGSGVAVERQNGAFGSWHSGGALFGFADGHVQWLSQEIDHSLYHKLAAIDDVRAALN